MTNPLELHVISDSTGETAAKLAQAVQDQFPDLASEVIRHPRIMSAEDVQLAAERARGRRAVVLYTLVDQELRAAMRQLCRRARVHYSDILGQPMEAVAKVSGRAAQMRPGARPVLDDDYFRRISAIEFAVRYDDGVPSGLEEADIVLVGVSRTSKTPLSMYLGYLGYKTANLPIVNGIEPPAELWEVEPARVVGLTIDAERLADIRQERARRLGGGNHRTYTQLVDIYDELDAAAAVHRRLGCPVIDTTELSIEETAARVIRLVEQRRRDAAAAGAGAA